MSNKKYIGVDLGAWGSNKTRIAVISIKDDTPILEQIIPEPLNSSYDYKKRDEALTNLLIELANNNALIAIDSPFTVPASLKDKMNEEFYEIQNKSNKNYNQINNPYIFDNSARFVLDITDETVLAPSASFIGAFTARMSHIFDNSKKVLNPIVDANLDKITKKINTIEVFPRASLKILLDFKEIQSYKNKNSREYFTKDDNKTKMLNILKKYELAISKELEESIKTDDDYDAIICALTAFLIDKYGYCKPNIKNVNEVFKNSFIYLPKTS